MYFLSRHTKSPFKKLKRRKLNTLKKKKKESKEYINSKKKKEKNVVSARLECFTQNGLDKGRRIIGGKNGPKGDGWRRELSVLQRCFDRRCRNRPCNFLSRSRNICAVKSSLKGRERASTAFSAAT